MGRARTLPAPRSQICRGLTVLCGVGGISAPRLQIKALEVSENRWKPSKPTDDEEKVYKQIKGLLNKLTLEKFDKLYQELLEIGIRCVSPGHG